MSDVVKFYIGKGIKNQSLNQNYYIYYAIGLTLVVYVTTKFLHK